jgi:transcriptional antiterminator
MEKVRAYTLQEIADNYQVSIRTVQAWLKPIKAELINMYPNQK